MPAVDLWSRISHEHRACRTGLTFQRRRSSPAAGGGRRGRPAAGAGPWQTERYRWLAAPLLYRQWNAAAQAQAAAEPAQFAQAATDGFYAGFEPDPALPGRLAVLAVPVLLVAGEYDIWPTCASLRALAALLGNADLALLPRTGHFPWVDDPASFAAAVDEFLARPPAPPEEAVS